jgi:hypothetical protein
LQSSKNFVGKSNCSSNGSSSIYGSKLFFGTSENAVKAQIWSAVCVYVLVAIVKKRLSVKASLYEMLQILSLTLFEKTHILQLFSDIPAQTSLSDTDNQLNLFN